MLPLGRSFDSFAETRFRSALKGRSFSCAVGALIFVITSGLQPAWDLLCQPFHRSLKAAERGIALRRTSSIAASVQ
jgi:hypothetical protein